MSLSLTNCIIDGVKSMKDGSMKITLVTRALDPVQAAEIFLNLNKEVLSVDIPEDPGEKKSPSQRLRGVLFVLWEQSYKDKYDSFEHFYRFYYEKIIDSIKDKLFPND